eukprot:m.249363 g.249363  ORF g.249363 m.249363 type:complete len:63 (+) comp15878_c0_seq3:2738-2926(+)
MPISRVNHRIVSSLAQSHLNVTPVMNPITRVPPCHGLSENKKSEQRLSGSEGDGSPTSFWSP